MNASLAYKTFLESSGNTEGYQMMSVKNKHF